MVIQCCCCGEHILVNGYDFDTRKKLSQHKHREPVALFNIVGLEVTVR